MEVSIPDRNGDNPIKIETKEDAIIALEMIRLHILDITPKKESNYADMTIDVILWLRKKQGGISNDKEDRSK